ncbi:hypothetical protein M0812_22826 [Anaeramoeba flamelloides]|uniref:RRM domain-containing protein n=1 Tax=Anaeramoeba flamelloides TaxID=1746091 RepID=A0AAV7YVJ4_9EUKA|nr:hypothetical protein M0812_22826 [Anaeramoeba flamelloides]
MNKEKIQKIFLKNLPSKYSIDKLVELIEDKTKRSTNIEIIKNKINPNNVLVIITPFSKENEAVIKQNLSDSFYFEQRRILMSEYAEDYKKKKKKSLFYSEKNKKENQNKKSNTSNNENRTKTNVQKNEKTLQNKNFKQSQSSNQKKKITKRKKNTKNVKNVPKPRKKSRKIWKLTLQNIKILIAKTILKMKKNIINNLKFRLIVDLH